MLSMLIPSKSKYLAYTTESTAGTFIAPATFILTREPKISRDIEMLALPFESAMGRASAVVGAQKGGATFGLEMVGSGNGSTPTPAWAGLLPSCGFKQAGNVFTLSKQSDYKTVSIGKYVDTVLDTIYGASGNVSFELVTNGKSNASFTYQGIYHEQTGVTAPNPSLTYKHGPVFRNAAVTWGLWSPKVSNVKVEVNNTYELAVASVGEKGFLFAFPTERTVTITLNPYLEAVADKAVVAELLSGTEAQFSVTLGTEAGNTMTLTAPKAQAESVGDTDREGFAAYDLKLVANGNTTTNGNGELIVTFA